jgi:hypothetical protein
VIAKKTKAALQEAQLSVIGCLGETLQEFESGQTEQVIYRQLKAYADVLTSWDRFVMYACLWSPLPSDFFLQRLRASLGYWHWQDSHAGARAAGAQLAAQLARDKRQRSDRSFCAYSLRRFAS